jgi:F-type H+-transporting ATPase subunit b
MELLDFRLLGTQIIGFLLVLWIMGKYAWPKVLGFIEERQHKIETDLKHAEMDRDEAAQLKSELDKELRNIEARARARIQEAVNEGQLVAAEVKAGAQKEASDRLARVSDEIEREREKAAESLKKDVVNLAMGTAEKILRQQLDPATRERLVDEFIDEVNVSP